MRNACLVLVVASALSACSESGEATSVETSPDELRSSVTCTLVSGADSPDLSGDGAPKRIELRRRSTDDTPVDVSLLGDWDLARPSSRGLPRECERMDGKAGEDLLVCRAEPEWNHFETTSTLRLPKGALDRRGRFDLVYHSARDNPRVAQGFSEWMASKRVFSCQR